MSQLDKLKIALGITGNAQDSELNLLLDDAGIDIMTWTNRQQLPPGLEPTQRQIAVIRYNMRGIEGQTAHSEGGIGRSFEELPVSIQATISQYRLIKAVKFGASAAT